jgi:hypothetical protein
MESEMKPVLIAAAALLLITGIHAHVRTHHHHHAAKHHVASGVTVYNRPG